MMSRNSMQNGAQMFAETSQERVNVIFSSCQQKRRVPVDVFRLIRPGGLSVSHLPWIRVVF